MPTEPSFCRCLLGFYSLAGLVAHLQDFKIDYKCKPEIDVNKPRKAEFATVFCTFILNTNAVTEGFMVYRKGSYPDILFQENGKP